MSKAYVIKNKEGKYPDDTQFQPFFTTKDICKTTLYKNFEEAQKARRSEHYKVVEITIAEGDLEKEIEHWHNLFKQKEQQFQSVRERYHLLNRLQANYDKKHKLHLSEMQCLELVEKNEDLEQQLAEKDKEIRKQVCDEIRQEFEKRLKGKKWEDSIIIGKVCNMINDVIDQIEQGEQQ